MSIDQDYIYSVDTVESILTNPDSSWKTLFKEMIISMIASNQNDLLWYANFLSRCEYEFHFNASFVSSVYFNGNNFVIVINPLILGLIKKDQVIAILKHSAGHIINHHFSRSIHVNSIDKKVVEVAKDIVINGCRDIPYIKDLPRTGSYKDSAIGALFYQTLTEDYGIQSYEVGREFEYYVELILAAKEENTDQNNTSCPDNLDNETNDEISIESDISEDSDENKTSSGSGEPDSTQGKDENCSDDDSNIASNFSEDKDENDSNEETNSKSTSLSEKTLEALENAKCNIDNHKFGEQLQEAVGIDENFLESFMDTTLKEMINDSTSFARGFTPGIATETLNKIEKRKSHKDWKKIFNKKMRNYLSNSLRYREPNKSRQHPIYPDDLDLYGYSPGKKPKLGVILDVSGSVNDKLLIALMSEVQAIQRKYSIKSITLIQVDAKVQAIEKFGVRDKFIVREGSGGTMMEPGFSALLRQSSREVPDMIICATDGDIEVKFDHVEIPNKVQVIWLINKEDQLLFDTSKYPKQQMHVISFSG